MKEYQELAPDAETFRRVWKRVMPDESMSRIVVHQAGEGRGQRPPKSAPAPNTKSAQEKTVGDEEKLRQLLQVLDEGLAVTGEILRRRPGAWPLRDSMRRSAAQVQAAWLLQTGRRWSAGSRPEGERENLGQLLRRQYVWEIRLSQLCRDLGHSMRAEDLREICGDMETESRRRRAMIRNLLAGT